MNRHANAEIQSAVLRLPMERILAAFAGASALLLVLCLFVQTQAVGISHRVLLALPIVLVLVAFASLFLAKKRFSRPDAESRRSVLWVSFALTAMVAVAGLVIIDLLILFPPPLARSAFKEWDYLDKRWLIAFFLLCSGLVYLLGLFQRLLAPATAAAPIARAVRASRALRRGLLAIAAGSVLALLYVAPVLSVSATRFVDVHEQAHLGGFQSIAQGALPYIDARTQYGPGQQILSYEMMRHSEFTLRGFRISQAWMNLVAVGVLFSLWLYAYGVRLGAAIVAAALAFSPLLIVTFWGWGFVLRWLAPVLVGTIVPPLLWREGRTRTRIVTIILLAVVCGALAWMAQEALTGAVIALGLLLAGAIVRGILKLRSAILLIVLFVAVEVSTLIALLVWSLGLAHLQEALWLYFKSTGLVFQGMTNTPWSQPDSPWQRAYQLTPTVILLITIAALYYRKPSADPEHEARIGQVLGMAAAAVPLAMLTLFRADSPHFVAQSTALAPLFVLAIAHLPGPFSWRINVANGTRVAMIGLVLALYYYGAISRALHLLYSNPTTNVGPQTADLRTFVDPRRIGNLHATLAGLELLRAGLPGTTHEPRSGDLVTRQLGFAPVPNARCCNNNEWTFAEWSDMLRGIHDDTAGRTTFVDVALPVESSGLYFLADLVVGTPYISRIMSVWTDDDIKAVKADLAQHVPACVVSGPGALFTETLLKAYGAYSTETLRGPTGTIMVYCKQPASLAPDRSRSAPLQACRWSGCRRAG